MMPEGVRLKFLLWSQDDEYQHLLDETNSLLAKWSKEYTAPMVSVSGGKDSTVMLHLVLQHWPGDQVVVWHWIHGGIAMPSCYAREVVTLTRKLIGDSGATLVVKKRRYTPGSRGMHQMFGNIKRVAKETERDCSFVGLRAIEAGRREQKTRGFAGMDNVTRLYALYPMREWRASDIWSYIVANDVPYLSYYDLFAQNTGTPYESERLRFSWFSFNPASPSWTMFGLPQGIHLWRERAHLGIERLRMKNFLPKKTE